MSKLSKLQRNKRTEAAKRRVANQPSRTESNRKIRRLKHLKKQPNDKQTAVLV